MVVITKVDKEWLAKEQKMMCHEYTPEGWIRHKILDGSRYHVLWYTSNGTHCSVPNCEINHRNKERGNRFSWC